MAANANSTPQLSSKSPTIRRILREAAELSNSPSPDYAAEPLETDLFEWHFTLRGPPNSVYSEGIYHGRIVLPATYPLRPPSFRFTTPSGRFEANREICLSISGHHEETWQPAWGIRTAIVALRSFMETDARGQLGGLETTEEVRRRLARESRSYKCSTCARSNADIISESERQVSEMSLPPPGSVAIPAELSMSWRDEVEAKRDRACDNESNPSVLLNASQNDDSDDAELAEGFVQTTPVRPGIVEEQQHRILPSGGNASLTNDGRMENNMEPNDRNLIPALQQQRLRTVRPQGDGVPLWVDRVIVALVIALAAVVLKVLFGI